METLYRKIIIKSEADLPKRTGKYTVKRQIYDSREEYKELPFILDENFYFEINHQGYKETWLEKVDWYLLPIDLLTDEEVNKIARKFASEWMMTMAEAMAFQRGVEWYRDKLLT